MECKELITELVNYLEASFAGKKPTMSPALAKHISECPDCRQFATDPKVSYYFLKMYHNHMKKEIKHSQILPHQLIKRPGQLWRFTYGEATKPQICAISSKSFNTSETSPYAVWIIPIKLNPNRLETSSNDITFNSKDTELDVPILLETWNKCPIYTSQLIDYIGDLSDSQWEKVAQYIQNPPQEEINSIIQVFRDNEFSKVEQFYSSDFIKQEKSVAILNYQNGSNVPWYAKIKDAFNDFINRIMAEDVAQLPFKTDIKKPETTALMLKPSKARSILDSVFSFFSSIDSDKLWHQTKTVGGAIGNMICAMGQASITALSESASTFYRELKTNGNEEIIKISSKLCAIEKSPYNTTLKIKKDSKGILKNIISSLPLFTAKNDQQNQTTEQAKESIADAETEADFKVVLEDEVLVLITSATNKHFNIRINCNECYFDFETSTGEIALSKNRLKDFSSSDISNIEIETDNCKYSWKI